MHNRRQLFWKALGSGIVVFLAFWHILSNKLIYHSLEVPFFWVHRGPLGSSGTKVKMAFLHLCRCDVRRQGPLYLLVTESQGKLPQLMPKPEAALPFPYEQPAEMKLCTHLGDFGKSPYSGISDAGYIQNFHFLQQNKDKEDEEGQRRKERNLLQTPRSCKAGLSQRPSLGKSPPNRNNAGRATSAADMPSWQAG